MSAVSAVSAVRLACLALVLTLAMGGSGTSAWASGVASSRGGTGSEDDAPQEEGRRRARLPKPSWEWFELDGYLRTRWGLLHNLDLDRGTTPTTGQPIFPVPPSDGQLLGGADARLRLDLGVHIGDVVRAQVRVDALDGLLLGSTPDGFPGTRWAPTPWAGLGQAPPSQGWNALADSIRLKHAYGEVLTPIGLLAFGRMPLPRWGLGIVTGRREDIDDDFDHDVDRLAFATSLADHHLGVAFDIGAIGPTSADSRGGGIRAGQAIDLELQDNLYTVSVSFGRVRDGAAILRRRAASRSTVGYGVYGTLRWQRVDFPTFYLDGIASEDASWTADDAVARRLLAVQVDGWLRFDRGPLRAEVEIAYVHAQLGDPTLQPGVSLPSLRGDQVAAALEVEATLLRGLLGIELGLLVASGDPAPGLGIAPPTDQATGAAGDLDAPQFDLGAGDVRFDNFRVHPGYRVDVIFWRRIAGAVTDAFVARPELWVRPGPRFGASLSATISRALVPRSTPSGRPFLGAEIDVSAEWTPVPGFRARGEYGLFLPGPALDNPVGDLRAKPAQILRMLLAVEF